MDLLSWRGSRVALAVVACAAVGGLAACGGSGSGSGASGSDTGPVKIGAIMSLTGPNASYGQNYRSGLELAAEQINAKDGIGGRKIKLIEEDTGGDTAKGVQAFNKLALQDKVTGVVTSSSAVALAQVPLITRDKMPTINAAAQDPKLRGASQYLFSDINDSNAEAKDLVTYAADKLGIKQADVLWVNDATGQAGDAALQAAAKAKGVTIKSTVSHRLDESDYSSVLSRLKSDNPKAVLVASHVDNMGSILKQAAQMGFHPTWLTLSPTVSGQTVKIAGTDAATGVYTIRSAFDAKQDVAGPSKTFVAAYQKRWNRPPDTYSAHFYDAVYLFKLAIESEGNKTDSASVTAGLAKLNGQGPNGTYQGASGPVVFDSDNTVAQPNFVLKYSPEGKLVAADSGT